mmetsp:Transcript_29985/g.95739  ORF Transcript_29985/g.95739 Transcript_29985/m.95739 type:complete len:230 (+) Transcript_29985:92-781(+)
MVHRGDIAYILVYRHTTALRSTHRFFARKIVPPPLHAPPPPATWWAASALVRRMHTTSERATSDKNYATYPRPHRHRQPAQERGPAPQRIRGTSAREKKRPPLFRTYSADRPARLPWVGGVHMRALAARLCASRSRAGRPATARTPRRSAGMWTSTRPPRRSPPAGRRAARQAGAPAPHSPGRSAPARSASPARVASGRAGQPRSASAPTPLERRPGSANRREAAAARP